MDDDEQRLTIMSDTLLTESVCGGEPMVILKSSTIPANGACLKAQSHYNLSCACFSGFANTTTWHFRIRSPDTAPKSPFPTVISVGDVVEVNSLMLYDTPPTLLILKIQGESSDLVPVNLEKATTGDDELAIVRSQDASSLTKVDISNLDLSDTFIGAEFVPSTLASLSMRNCNLSSLSQPFLESFSALASLNLAANKISSIYGSLPGSAEALSAMTDINLANNSFTEFPVQLLKFPNLQKLDMSGNDISNLTVTNDELAIISQLAVFKVDVSSSFARVDCTSGELQEAHNTEFCVVNGSIPGQDNPDERRSQEQKILEKVALGSLRPTFYNDCPPGILALAASCLEGRPENRPSASEIVLTIKELMREIQLDNRPHPEPEPDDIATEGFLSTE
ncbi:hypothetical protein PRIC2_013193 [Phytophthora ramorum]